MERAYKKIRTTQATARRRRVGGRPIRRAPALAWAPAPVAVPVPRAPSSTFNRQVRALLNSKVRDAADITRDDALINATTAMCLTSGTDFGSAASGTGLLQSDSDEVRINWVRFKGRFDLLAALDLDPVGDIATVVRRIVVWFNKPLLVASAAGTLPPVTEVLVTNEADSLEYGKTSNGGRFVILSDRYFNLGTNTYQSVTAAGHARINGKISWPYDYTVKVGRMCKFKAPSSVDAGNGGGHYDSDNPNGQVSSGLLVCYTLFSGAQIATDFCVTRLNYTG